MEVEPLSDFEKKRLANIAEKKALLATLLPQINSVKDELAASVHPKKPQLRLKRTAKRRLTVINNSDYVPRRSQRIEQKALKTKKVKGFKGFREVMSETKCDQSDTTVDYVCDDDDTDNDDWENYEKIEFYISTEEEESEGTEDSEEEEDDDDDDDSSPLVKRKPSYRRISIPALKVEDITEEMLQNISINAGNKVYDAVNGTCCHQCRQKTLDTKSICRSGVCPGVRGQFCGPCLLNRYGEEVSVVLKDPDWQCPPCRGVCNCSICRTRQGKAPTGILVPFVKEKGYASVNEYLKKNESEEPKEKRRQWRIKLVGIREN